MHQGGFAAPVRTQHTDQLTRLEMQLDPFEHIFLTISAG
jgi:hypothetical protein